jgi:ubiquinone/menaquinone biosynthesis C-methylase UbiE
MTLSPRLQAAVDALPLVTGMRVLEIGCGPGAAARAVAHRVAPGFVLAVDRSPRAVALARRACAAEIEAGLLDVWCADAETLVVPDSPAFDLAFALRVGALDGRHPEAGQRALTRLAAVLHPRARLFVDGGSPLREVDLSPFLPGAGTPSADR